MVASQQSWDRIPCKSPRVVPYFLKPATSSPSFLPNCSADVRSKSEMVAILKNFARVYKPTSRFSSSTLFFLFLVLLRLRIGTGHCSKELFIPGGGLCTRQYARSCESLMTLSPFFNTFASFTWTSMKLSWEMSPLNAVIDFHSL